MVSSGSSSRTRLSLAALIALLTFLSDSEAFTAPAYRAVTPTQLLFVPHKRQHGTTTSNNQRRTTSIVFQSSIGYDSGTQLPASNNDDTSSATATAVMENDTFKEEEILTLESASSMEVIPFPDDTAVSKTLALNDSDEGALTKKILNGLLLAASFGFAAYTILNIDAGMTRGWTQSEIAMRIPLDNWLNYESSLADRPVFTKTAINVIIYLLGDWLSQTVFAKKDPLDFDATRTLRNGFIGLCFGPLVVQYYQFSDHILPVEGGMWNRLEKILMDQTLYLTVKCSIYIAAVGLLSGDDPHTVKTNVQTKLPNIVVTAWKFWPLVHLVTYGIIPARHRILWVNCVDLVWNAILAGMTTKSNDEEVVTEDAVLTAVATVDGHETFNGAEGIMVVEEQPVLQVQQSDATVTHHTTSHKKEEDPFLLHQDLITIDKSSGSLFEETAQNMTVAETMIEP